MWDLLKNVSHITLFVKLFMSVCFYLLLIYSLGGDLCIDSVMPTLITLNVTLVGFGIAALAIVLSFSKEVIEKINDEDESKRNPYDVVMADMTFFILMNAVNLGLLMFLYIYANMCLLQISIALSFFNILWSIHVALHMLSLRTFIGK